ncbi:MAG TPA: hypothetical protein VK906_09875 [Egicoccus sp.]|nr:hypothetical protein [Egicoccus sp.]HSK23474.1 hypothetical protein [Egicoccus sp.]
MPIVSCPDCGEDEDLSGRPEDERILLTCGACGRTWDRDTRLVCRLCGAEDIEGIPTSTLQEAGRGEQWAPSGIRLVYYCWSCQGNDVTSSTPDPGPHPPPGTKHDVKSLRRPDR